MTCCGECRYWTAGFYKVVGECEIDMETKGKYHKPCINFEQRDENVTQKIPKRAKSKT